MEQEDMDREYESRGEGRRQGGGAPVPVVTGRTPEAEDVPGEEKEAAEVTAANLELEQEHEGSTTESTRLEEVAGPESGVHEHPEERDAEEKADDVINSGILRM